MDIVKGFRFRPTDEELIEYLQDKTFDRDSLVQVIAEVHDICELEPWELPERSALQTVDRLWYFMYPPKYKYRNSKRISRTTLEGYWKPTGNARKIINTHTGEEIGSKKTLVFYKGQCNDKNKNKTCWVMHEYELTAAEPTHSDHDVLDLKGSSAPEASNGSVGIHTQSSSVETYAGERSNQYNIVNEDKGSNLSSNSVNHVAEEIIPQGRLHLKALSTEPNGPNDNNKVQNLYSTTEQDDESCNSILTNNDETDPIERSNQHNVVVTTESFEVPFNLDYLAHEDLIPTELLYNALLLAEPEATNNSNWIQNQHITNSGEDGESLNSSFADSNEVSLQEGSSHQSLAAANKGFRLPCIGVMESPISMEKSRKRPRHEFDGLSHDVQTGEAQPWGKEYPSSSNKSIESDCYNIIATRKS
ncbi:NAC domain-containing protein 83-like isoform X2 [Herrania umbratica]|uniref:NAC domain-containing protein 83-like isoform X2 n=1 Tax=Herrania umbratica TaxID=108875 RepID=A0A6J1BPL1_9ROSI|nr:NAC domain-containing protein 83-like isoform X2 [Herrania umbratica]